MLAHLTAGSFYPEPATGWRLWKAWPTCYLLFKKRPDVLAISGVFRHGLFQQLPAADWRGEGREDSVKFSTGGRMRRKETQSCLLGRKQDH